MKRRICALALLLAWCGVALASEESKRLYSRGLVHFHAGRLSEARVLFDQAVAADPADIYARHYRGVTRGRLGDLDTAISDLRTVLAAKPDLHQAALDLGVALVKAGKYAEAVAPLEQAQAVRELDGEASLFLGLARLRTGELAEARLAFYRAATRDPTLHLPATYYRGVVDYQEGEIDSAKERFNEVVADNPETEMGREAAAFLAKIRQSQRATYQLYGELGFQYDTNVVLAPSNDVVKADLSISRQEDGRETINVGGSYIPWRTERAQLVVGYDFFQSLHFDLTDFNLQNHRASADLSYSRDLFQVGFSTRYDFFLLKSDEFVHEVTALPWIAIPEGDLGHTEIFYRMRRREFLDNRFRDRSAFNHAAGVRQYFYLVGTPDRYALAGYRFDRENPVNASGDAFAYNGNQLEVGLGWLFPAEVSVEASFSFRHENYDNASLGRRDGERSMFVVVEKHLTERLTLTGAYFGTLNSSSDENFDYDRHIGSIALELRL